MREVRRKEKEKRGKKSGRMRRDGTEKGKRKCEDDGKNCQRKEKRKIIGR